MSFRKELKTILSYSNTESFNKWIIDNGGKLLFNVRDINSIYYENDNFSMYYDSIEGSVPRKKIRVRNYNKFHTFDSRNNNLELKISSAEGRFKKTTNLSSFNLSSYIVRDTTYGICKPLICVSYKRIYYKIKNFRLTIDKDIKYRKISFGKISDSFYVEKNNIIEIKYTKNEDQLISELFPFTFVRFSKYCRAVEFIYRI